MFSVLNCLEKQYANKVGTSWEHQPKVLFTDTVPLAVSKRGGSCGVCVTAHTG